jgi:hypothetical protein
MRSMASTIEMYPPRPDPDRLEVFGGILGRTLGEGPGEGSHQTLLTLPDLGERGVRDLSRGAPELTCNHKVAY